MRGYDWRINGYNSRLLAMVHPVTVAERFLEHPSRISNVGWFAVTIKPISLLPLPVSTWPSPTHLGTRLYYPPTHTYVQVSTDGCC